MSADSDLIRELRDESIYDPVRHQAAAAIERLTHECASSMDEISRERERADGHLDAYVKAWQQRDAQRRRAEAAEAALAKAREALETANTWINVNYDRDPVPDSIHTLQSIILAALAPEGKPPLIGAGISDETRAALAEIDEAQRAAAMAASSIIVGAPERTEGK